MDETITKRQAIEAISDELDRIDHVPQWIFNRLERAIRKLPSKESESFEWCTDCKEYDHERHCCPRFSKLIARTVEEMQIVRCKDCIYADYKNVVKALWCSEGGRGKTVAPDDFCSYAERRQNEHRARENDC